MGNGLLFFIYLLFCYYLEIICWEKPLMVYLDLSTSRFYLIIDSSYCMIKDISVVTNLGFDPKKSYLIDNIHKTNLKPNENIVCPISIGNSTISTGLCDLYIKHTLQKLKVLNSNLHVITSVQNFGRHVNPSIIPFLGQFIMSRSNYPQLVVIDENLNDVAKLEYTSSERYLNWYELDYRLLKISNDKILMVYTNILDYPNVYVAYRTLVYNSYDESFLLTDPIKLDKKGLSYREKNWIPFTYKGDIYFISKVLSLQIYKLSNEPTYTASFLSHDVTAKKVEFVSEHSCQLYAYSSGATWEYGDIRGGTPALYIPTYGYLGFFHSKYIGLKDKKCGYYYYIGAYIFTAKIPFQMLKISPQPIILSNIIYNARTNANHESRIYPMSFYSLDNQDQIINDDFTIPTTIVITAGYNITNGYSIRIDFNILLRSMVNVSCY